MHCQRKGSGLISPVLYWRGSFVCLACVCLCVCVFTLPSETDRAVRCMTFCQLKKVIGKHNTCICCRCFYMTNLNQNHARSIYKLQHLDFCSVCPQVPLKPGLKGKQLQNKYSASAKHCVCIVCFCLFTVGGQRDGGWDQDRRDGADRRNKGRGERRGEEEEKYQGQVWLT